MKRIFKGCGFIWTATLLTLGSCSADSPWSGGGDGESGNISLSLATDFSVTASTRAADNVSPVRPSGDVFKIRLESSDGSYAKEWETLSKFNNEESFPKGTYTVTATYGSLNEQGFKNPHYVGTETLVVKAGETCEQSVTASLANSMVSIRYSESFTNYFSQYSASLVADGISDPVVFAKGEDRPAYVKPGNVKVNFNISNSDDQEVTVSPATFTALPRRHYIITANVKETETAGQFALSVEFTEDVISESVDIVLSDELFTTPAPEIKAKDFTFGGSINTFESVALDVNPQFQIIAEAGIAEASFSVTAPSDDYLPKFGSSVELMGADAVEQQLIEQSYLKCYGFFRVPGGDSGKVQMGVIDMKEFIEHLKPGEYTFTLSVKDKLGRVFESETPVSLKASIETINFKVTEDTTPPVFMGNEASVLVYTNYEGAKDQFTFKVDRQDASVKNVETIEGSSQSESGYSYCFRYYLSTDVISDTKCNIEVSYPNKSSKVVEIEDVQVPKYSVAVDAFAKRAMIKIEPEDPANLEMLVKNAKIYDGNSEKTSGISRDPQTGIITITDLDANTAYNGLGVVFGSSPSRHKTSAALTTEAETDVPNGEFSKEEQTINLTGIQVGGKYKVSPVDYTIKSSIVRSTPTGWATVNALTCYSGSSNKNTWFLVPSTYSDDGKVKILNVGYNHSGTTPATSGGAFNIKYYCENAPSADGLVNKAGELFLGSYSYDGTEDRTDGISFESRPSYLQFEYDYSAVSGDSGDVYVKILDASGKVIAENNKILGSDATTGIVKLPLTGYPFGSKAAMIQVCFRSSNKAVPPINIPSGSELKEEGASSRTIDANTYHAVATGSVLIIDNVKLGYE